MTMYFICAFLTLVELVFVHSMNPHAKEELDQLQTGDDGEHRGITSPEIIKAIVDEHNKARRSVVPSASNMREMRWNATLAKISQQNAEKCLSKHYLHGYGENIWSSTSQLQLAGAVRVWDYERNYYHYGNNSCDKGRVCGHYTQIVWATTYAVGCGYATECNHYWAIQVYCTYYPMGNVVGWLPYTNGTPCDDCRCGFSCRDGLCVKDDDYKDCYEEEMKKALNKICDIRKNVSPPQSNMGYLVWNETLAEQARKEAEQCTTEYSYGKGYTAYSARGGLEMEKAVDFWINVAYDYHSDTCTDGRWWCALEYKQVLNAKTTQIGCGATIDCHDRYNVRVRCKFDVKRGSEQPYETGEPCEDCECGYTCKDGFCLKGDDSHCLEDEMKKSLRIFNVMRCTASPQSSDMRMLKWSDSLAKAAQKEADACNRAYTYGNGATSYRAKVLDINAAIRHWVNVHYDFKSNRCTDGRWWCSLEYKQVMNARTEYVGCGASTNCGGGRPVVIWCKYEKRRNMWGKRPYRAGAPCTHCGCGYSCKDGLCVKGDTSKCIQPDIDCYTGRGVNYRGKANISMTGLKCLHGTFCRNYAPWKKTPKPVCPTKIGWKQCRVKSCDEYSKELWMPQWNY